MISVLILTGNEEMNLPRCLDSVRWSDDVLVLDCFSTDRTVEIAEATGARVIQRRFDTFADQRNFGIRNGAMSHDWVLHLDADEVVTPALRDELQQIAASADKDAYRLASKMMFRGQWLRHAGMFPSYQVRFGRRDRLTFKQVGHGQREDIEPDRIGTLSEALLHFSFSKGLDEWFAKHNVYSAAEARHALLDTGVGLNVAGIASGDPMERRRALKRLASRLPFRPTLRFLYMFLVRGGWRDGSAGYTYCQLLATYEKMIVLKSQELRALQRKVSL